jgi:hypothetical protein
VSQLPEFEGQGVIDLALGALVGIISWLGSRLWGKVDTMQEVQANHAKSFVERHEMQKHLDDLRVEVQRDIDTAAATAMRMHAENLSRFDKIDSSMNRLHDRIDGATRRGNEQR